MTRDGRGRVTVGGANYMGRPNGAVHVNPDKPNGNPEGTPGIGGSARRLKTSVNLFSHDGYAAPFQDAKRWTSGA